MTPDSPTLRSPLARFPTRIDGLDTILEGGLFIGGVYLIQGVPGSGKTILANQICFGSLAAGGSAVYLTLLAESHSRLIQHLQSLEFFDRTAIPDRIHYVSAFRQLQTGGLNGVLSIAQSEVASRAATVLVIDGISVAAEAAETAQETKRFVHDLQALASMHGCTIFLLRSGASSLVRAEDTMVDGSIFLEADLLGSRPERRVSIMKSRGGGALAGAHAFVIDQSGLRIFPRMETVFTEAPPDFPAGAITSAGVGGLDAMLAGGGLPSCSATVISGPSGSGKTSMALHFLDAGKADEPGLALGFFEAPGQLLRKSDALGLGLREAAGQGTVKILWRAPGDYLLDELGYSILAEIDRRKVRRLVIDGMSGIFGSLGYKRRELGFVACLFNEIRRRGVTTVVTQEIGAGGLDASRTSSGLGLTSWADNVIRLESTQEPQGVRRSLWISKCRDSGYDSSIRTFTMSKAGVAVEAPAPPLPDAGERVPG